MLDADDDYDITPSTTKYYSRQCTHSLFLLILLHEIFFLFTRNLEYIFLLFFLIAYRADAIKRCLPNLHSLGELLLPCFLRQLFTLTVLLSLYVEIEFLQNIMSYSFL